MNKAMLLFAILALFAVIVSAAPIQQPYCLDYERANNPSTIGIALFRNAESGWKLSTFSDTCQDAATVVQGVCRGKIFEKSPSSCSPGTACFKGTCINAEEVIPILETIGADERFAGFCAERFPAGADEPESEQATACALDNFPTRDLAAHLKKRTDAMSSDEKQKLFSSLGFEGDTCQQQVTVGGFGGSNGADGGCFVTEQMKAQMTAEQLREFEQRCKQQVQQMPQMKGPAPEKVAPEMQGISEEHRKAMMFGKGMPTFQQGMNQEQMQKMREQMGAPMPALQRWTGEKEAAGGVSGGMGYCAIDERMKQAMTPEQLIQWQARCGPGMKVTGFFSRFGNYFRK